MTVAPVRRSLKDKHGEIHGATRKTETRMKSGLLATVLVTFASGRLPRNSRKTHVTCSGGLPRRIAIWRALNG